MLCHFQSGVSQYLLEHQSVATTIHKIFASEGVSIEMCAGFVYTTGLVMASHGQSQTIHGQHTTILVTEQVILWLASPNGHILTQYGHHQGAEGNSLDFAVFVMTQQDLSGVQVHIPVLNITDSRRTAATVHKEIDDDPISIFAERTILFGAFQQSQKLLVCIGFLDCFLIFDIGKFRDVQPPTLTPVGKGAKHSTVRGDGVMGQSRSTHGNHHCLQVLASQVFQWLLDVKVIGNTVDVVTIGVDGNIRQSLCCLGDDKVLKNLSHRLARLSIHRDFSCHN